MSLTLNSLKPGSNSYNNAVASGKSTAQVTIAARVPLSQRAPQTFTSKTEAASIHSNVGTVIAPANAIGRNADGSYIFAPAPSNAIGQNADGSYILGQTDAKISESSSNSNGLPNISAFDLIRGAVNGLDTAATRIEKPIVSAGKDIIGGVDSYNTWLKKQGGAPGIIGNAAKDAITGAGEVVGDTAAAVLKPIAVPLLLGVAVYAFASSR